MIKGNNRIIDSSQTILHFDLGNEKSRRYTSPSKSPRPTALSTGLHSETKILTFVRRKEYFLTYNQTVC